MTLQHADATKRVCYLALNVVRNVKCATTGSDIVVSRVNQVHRHNEDCKSFLSKFELREKAEREEFQQQK